MRGLAYVQPLEKTEANNHIDENLYVGLLKKLCELFFELTVNFCRPMLSCYTNHVILGETLITT